MPIIERLAGTLDFLQDAARLGCPNEWFGIAVVVVDVFPDRHDQIFHVAENPTTDALVCEIAEKALHHVEPGTTGRRELHVKTRMPGQPPVDLGVFVSGVVICNQVVFFDFGIEVVNYPQTFCR